MIKGNIFSNGDRVGLNYVAIYEGINLYWNKNNFIYILGKRNCIAFFLLNVNSL